MREVLMNEKTNLLQLEEHFYQLVDVDEPNTFRNLFPYSEVPKIAFNDRIVPHNIPVSLSPISFTSSKTFLLARIHDVTSGNLYPLSRHL